MPKRRITHRQAKRIAKRHDERVKEAKTKTGQEREGLVIAHFGQKADVEDANGQVFQCLLRQHMGFLVAGDWVVWQQNGPETGVIVARKPRHHVLTKQDRLGEKKPMAANVDQMVIVFAPEPTPTHLLLDSYLILSTLAHIPPILVFNKIDLPKAKAANYKALLKDYENLGFSVLITSTKAPETLFPLTNLLKDHVNVFVGQSGVGKSALIQTLLPNENIEVGTLTQDARHGKHTTTTARYYHIPTGGGLIDSPGIRTLTLSLDNVATLQKGFPEFSPFEGQCQFRNCQHKDEPGCVVVQALGKGEIQSWRYANYLKLLATLQ